MSLHRFFRRRQWDRERLRELESHLAHEIDDSIAGGMTPEEARREAYVKLGNPTLVREEIWQMNSISFLENPWRDVSYALRQLRKSPGFAATAVLTLALGIGINTAIFSLINTFLLRPLPYKHPGRLVMVWEQLRTLGIDHFEAPLANYLDYRKDNHVFEDMAAVENRYVNLTTQGLPERILALRTTANLFPALGIRPALGRSFVNEDNQPGNSDVAILSDGLWRDRFGANPNVLGKKMTLDGQSYLVVGVMPAGLRFSTGSPELPAIWMPLSYIPDPNRNTGRLQMIARLKPGVSLATARADLQTISKQLEQKYRLYVGPHGENAGYTVSVIPLRDNMIGDMREGLLLMFGAVGLILLIACANVANLMLAHGMNRGQELALRVSLGASRSRLLQMLVTESILLAFLGGSFGFVLSLAGFRFLLRWNPNDAARIFHATIDLHVLLFTLLASMLTAVLSGLVPSLIVLRQNSAQLLTRGVQRTAGTAGRLARRILVVGEIALSVCLVIGAGLLIHSFILLKQAPLGLNPENVVAGNISLPQLRYSKDQQIEAFYSALLQHVAAMPGVKYAAAASALPLAGISTHNPFSIEGRPWQQFGADRIPQFTNNQAVSSDYFRVLEIPLIRGRWISNQDRADSLSVVVVNKTLVRGFFPSQNPIGKHIMLGAPRPGARWLTIVGVVADVRSGSAGAASQPEIYTSMMQTPGVSMSLLVRSKSGSPENLVPPFRRDIASLENDIPLDGVISLDQLVSNSVAGQRYYMVLLACFALLALILASVGIYGVIAYTVVQRTQEIGIRMALGAQRGAVLRMILGQGLRLAIIGIALGLVVARLLARFLASSLFEIHAGDPLTYLVVAIILLGTALIASCIPAYRAASIEPMQALRAE